MISGQSDRSGACSTLLDVQKGPRGELYTERKSQKWPDIIRYLCYSGTQDLFQLEPLFPRNGDHSLSAAYSGKQDSCDYLSLLTEHRQKVDWQLRYQGFLDIHDYCPTSASRDINGYMINGLGMQAIAISALCSKERHNRVITFMTGFELVHNGYTSNSLWL